MFVSAACILSYKYVICAAIFQQNFTFESDGPVLHNYWLLEYIYTPNSNAKGINYVRTSQRQNG